MEAQHHFRAEETEKKMKEQIKIFVLTISGILFAYILFESYHYDNIFQIFFYLIFGGIGLYIFYNGIFDNLEIFKRTKELKSYYLTFMGVFLIILNLGIFSYYEIKINAKTLLKVNQAVYADFKENGSYIIKTGSWASKQHFYGKYHIKDSLIILDKNYFDEFLVTNKFVIRRVTNTFTKENNKKVEKYLIQLDQSNKEIKNKIVDFDKSKNAIYGSFKYEIIEDNRK